MGNYGGNIRKLISCCHPPPGPIRPTIARQFFKWPCLTPWIRSFFPLSSLVPRWGTHLCYRSSILSHKSRAPWAVPPPNASGISPSIASPSWSIALCRIAHRCTMFCVHFGLCFEYVFIIFVVLVSCGWFSFILTKQIIFPRLLSPSDSRLATGTIRNRPWYPHSWMPWWLTASLSPMPSFV